MIRKENVVILSVGDIASARLLEHEVPVRIAAQRRLGQIEPANALILEAGDDICGFIGAAVADDEQLEVPHGLPEHRRDCVAEHVSTIVGREQNADQGPASISRHGAGRRSQRRRRRARYFSGSRSPLIGHDPCGSLGVPRQIEGVGCVIGIHRGRHIDDDRFPCADVFPPVIEVGRDDQQPRVLLADGELVQAA